MRKFTARAFIMQWCRARHGWIAGAAVFGAIGACASQGSHLPQGETGAGLYASHCAVCHGADARGHGVIAPYLKAWVPDLTSIAARAGGDFPEEKIFRIVDGQSEEQFTPRRHMPIWGYEFFGDEAEDRAAHDHSVRRVNELVAYLRAVQCVHDCGDLP